MDQKRFLITGGSQGIGAALVTLARKAGHRVVFTGRHDDTIGQVVGETGAFGLRADSSSGDDNQKTVEVCTQQMGGVDVLVNNAASWYDAAIGELDLDAMRRLFDTNVFGMVDLTNRVVPLMKAQTPEGGDIVNIASTSGTKGRKLGTAYAASKWAVRGMTKAAAMELATHGIRVNSIHPGFIHTHLAVEEESHLAATHALLDAHTARLAPMGRTGEPEEIARLALFLASDESSYSTGAEFVADGGLVAGYPPPGSD